MRRSQAASCSPAPPMPSSRTPRCRAACAGRASSTISIRRRFPRPERSTRASEAAARAARHHRRREREHRFLLAARLCARTRPAPTPRCAASFATLVRKCVAPCGHVRHHRRLPQRRHRQLDRHRHADPVARPAGRHVFDRIRGRGLRRNGLRPHHVAPFRQPRPRILRDAARRGGRHSDDRRGVRRAVRQRVGGAHLLLRAPRAGGRQDAPARRGRRRRDLRRQRALRESRRSSSGTGIPVRHAPRPDRAAVASGTGCSASRRCARQ